jgi:hypothetical protein
MTTPASPIVPAAARHHEAPGGSLPAWVGPTARAWAAWHGLRFVAAEVDDPPPPEAPRILLGFDLDDRRRWEASFPADPFLGRPVAPEWQLVWLLEATWRR